MTRPLRQALFGLLAGLLSGAAGAIPAIDTWTTASGARVLLVSTPDLPIVDLRVAFDAGSARDDATPGLARFTSGLLFDGADGLDAQAIASGFERLGAQYGAQAERDMAVVSLRSLVDAPQLGPAVDLLARILAKPDFPDDAVARARRTLEVALAQQREQPGQIASRAFYQAAYRSHPYANWPDGEPETLALLTRSAAQGFHRRYYVARNAVLAIVGDLDRPAAQALAERLLSGLPSGAPAPALGAVLPLAQEVNERIHHPSAQAHILLGAPVLTRDDPDYFPLVVGNHVLGGSGLVSRVSNVIREQRGLAYSAYSYFIPMRAAGPFVMGLQTRGDQAGEATALLRQTLDEFIADGPSEQELAAAQRNLTGGFPLRLDSNKDIVEYLAVIGFYRLPLDWLDRYVERVNAVTVQQVRDAFARRIDPERLVLIRVGGDAATGSR
ncbi:pitrilysin family protein [Immundisolibacter sp.]|uniref:M16 family metallopeptidase n=1 Tax=Immundisolibacter sp. TaxID=1934948 RepID=UPI0026169C14|nr:pitrilysin family protein [Immundisolibacter sp.]MDD3652307.1 pitrilysin family protein [Immundisolibacter sp.]